MIVTSIIKQYIDELTNEAIIQPSFIDKLDNVKYVPIENTKFSKNDFTTPL